MSQAMTQPKNVEQKWSQYASKVLQSGCALGSHVTLEQLSNCEFTCTQDKSNLFAGMLSLQKAEGNILKVDTSSQMLGKHRIWETTCLFDWALSKIHDAEVHVFSDSVLCMGKGAMHELEDKFTRRWNDYPERYRESARWNDGEKGQVVFTIFIGKKTHEIVNESLSGSEEVKEKMDIFFYWHLSSSCSIYGCDEGHSDFFRGTERRWGKALFLQGRGKKCSLHREVQAPILHVHRSRFRKGLELRQASRWPKRKMGWTCTASCGRVHFVQEHPILKRCINLQKAELKKGGANMHFHADDSSFKKDGGSQQFSQRHL